jgi:WD40 repeat protein
VHVWTSGDAKLKVWNASKLDVHREINIDAFVLAMTQVDDQIWAACNDKKIRIFNTKVDAPISIWALPPTVAHFSFFFSLPQTFKMEKEFEAHSRKVNDVVAGKNYVYTSSDDRAVSAWQTDTTTRVCKVRVPPTAQLCFTIAACADDSWSSRANNTQDSCTAWRGRASTCGQRRGIRCARLSLHLLPCAHMSEHTELTRTHYSTVHRGVGVRP